MSETAILSAVVVPAGEAVRLEKPPGRPWADLWEMSRLEGIDYYGHADFVPATPEQLRANRAVPSGSYDVATYALYLPASATLSGEAIIVHDDRDFDADTGETMIGTIDINRPLRDNLDTAFLGVFVADPYRGHGVEEAALALARSTVLSAGRSKAVAWVSVPPPAPGEATMRPASGPGEVPASDLTVRLYADNGFRLEHVEKSSVFEIGRDAERAKTIARLAARRDEISPPDLGARTWESPIPDEWVDRFVEAFNLFEEDLPRPEALEPETVTRESLAQSESSNLERGWHTVHGILTDQAEQIVAISAIVHRGTATAGQARTWVRREHRGRGLGEYVKIVTYLAAIDSHPGLERVTTENAESNAPMWAINERLGFRVAYLEANWCSYLVDGGWTADRPGDTGKNAGA